MMSPNRYNAPQSNPSIAPEQQTEPGPTEPHVDGENSPAANQPPANPIPVHPALLSYLL